MTPIQYLAACKTKMGHCTTYALAKKWDMDKSYVRQMLNGQRPINAHVAMLIAITLELDPVQVLADIEAQQQTGKAGEFWRSFLLRVRQVAALTACTLLLGLSAGTASDPAGAGGRFKRRLRCA